MEGAVGSSCRRIRSPSGCAEFDALGHCREPGEGDGGLVERQLPREQGAGEEPLTQMSANPSASAWMAKRRISAGVARSPAWGRWMPKCMGGVLLVMAA